MANRQDSASNILREHEEEDESAEERHQVVGLEELLPDGDIGIEVLSSLICNIDTQEELAPGHGNTKPVVEAGEHLGCLFHLLLWVSSLESRLLNLNGFQNLSDFEAEFFHVLGLVCFGSSEKILGQS